MEQIIYLKDGSELSLKKLQPVLEDFRWFSLIKLTCAHKNSRLSATDRTPRLLPLLQKGLRLLLQSFDVLLAAVLWVRRGVVWVIARVLAVVIDEAVLVFILVFIFIVSGGVFLSGTSGGGCRQQTVLTGLHAETLQTSQALQEVTHQRHFTWRHCSHVYRTLVLWKKTLM